MQWRHVLWPPTKDCLTVYSESETKCVDLTFWFLVDVVVICVWLNVSSKQMLQTEFTEHFLCYELFKYAHADYHDNIPPTDRGWRVMDFQGSSTKDATSTVADMWYAAGDLLCGIYIYMAAVVGLLKIIHVSLVSSVILRRKLFTPAWVAHSNLNCHKVRPGLSSFTFAVSMPDSMKMLLLYSYASFFAHNCYQSHCLSHSHVNAP